MRSLSRGGATKLTRSSISGFLILSSVSVRTTRVSLSKRKEVSTSSHVSIGYEYNGNTLYIY